MTIMNFLLANIITSGLLSAVSAANVILELAYGRPQVAAGSAAVMVLAGLWALFGCARWVVRSTEDCSHDSDAEETLAR